MTKKIMVVDDDPAILVLIEEILEGFEVVSTTNPLDAIEIFKKQNVQLVISDYKMPKMNGLELYAGLRKISQNRESSVPFMVVTGYCDAALEAKAYALGICAVLNKPFDSTMLRADVERCIHMREGQ